MLPDVENELVYRVKLFEIYSEQARAIFMMPVVESDMSLSQCSIPTPHCRR